MLFRSGVKPIVPNTPDGVEVCERSGNGKTVLILINHNTTPQQVTLPDEMTNLLASDHARVSSVNLPKYGVAVLEK